MTNQGSNDEGTKGMRMRGTGEETWGQDKGVTGQGDKCQQKGHHPSTQNHCCEHLLAGWEQVELQNGKGTTIRNNN